MTVDKTPGLLKASTGSTTDDAKSTDSWRPELPQVDPETARVVWRDVIFLLLGCVAMSIIGYVETHAMDADARFSVHYFTTTLFRAGDMPLNPLGIVDTGFILTYPTYEFLKDHRDWNDFFAGLNSVILIIPSIYIAYVTVWKGDYEVSFRLLFTQLLRSFCGWFTYLPPDPTYLASYYDFPDFVQCMFRDCRATAEAPEVLPFVSFFSGHVATMVIVANHMALNKQYRLGFIIMHILNVLQIVRLLATRGHYSIDMIIGWYVAVQVSNPAGRLGRYYSRGTMQEMLPKTPAEAFDIATGVADTRRQRRMSTLMQRPEVQQALQAMEDGDEDEVQSETTARILQEAASKMVHEQAEALEEEIQKLQLQAKQAMDAMREKQQRLRENSASTTAAVEEVAKKDQ